MSLYIPLAPKTMEREMFVMCHLKKMFLARQNHEHVVKATWFSIEYLQKFVFLDILDNPTFVEKY